MYYTCDSGNWGDCEADLDLCAFYPEICYSSGDEDGDGLYNCEDIDCYDMICDNGADTTNCGDYGFYRDGHFRCCSSTSVYDCDSNGDADSCGPCDCIDNPLTPIIEDVSFTQGEKKLTVEWDLECGVPFVIWRCAGDECQELTGVDYTSLEGAGYNIIDEVEDVREYEDMTIASNTKYCYLIEAGYDYPTFSDAICVESGDDVCHEISTNNFCLDELGGFGEDLVYVVSCDAYNKVVYETNCKSEYGADYYCSGPDANEEAECVYQSDCDECGDPLGLFGDEESTASYISSLLSVITVDTVCTEIPTCYFDYTKTVVDAFQDCTQISSCYDYNSQYACEDQSTQYANNKCLRRMCEWEYIDEELNIGICKETMDEFKSCDKCNDAEFNDVFGACTLDRCREFGEECYLSQFFGCTDWQDVSCTDFQTSEECGSTSVAVDAFYELGYRTSGTNEITTRSNDALDFGVCRWDASLGGCFKDADGNEVADDFQNDFTPPITTFLSDEKVSSINLTVLAQDVEPDGTVGSGVKAVYYCLDETGLGCYPDELVELVDNTGKIEIGEGGGVHDIYYYAEDNANNLEVVKMFSAEVDKTPPVITITYYVQPDIDSYSDSGIIFDVQTDEIAYCTDEFEGTEANQLDEEKGDHFIVKYEGLTDGYYTYRVWCADPLGNQGYESVMARVDADIVLFDPEPAILTDESAVTLQVKTLYDADCGFEPGLEVDRFESMTNRFDKASEGDYYLHTYPGYTLSSNGEYFFDVKCDMTTLGRTSDDEIQFVFDNTAPSTYLDDGFGYGLNYSAFYRGESFDIYLKCEDDPQDGFGCDYTMYCMDTTMCTPDTQVDYFSPLDYDLTESNSVEVCYQSIEYTYLSMGGLYEDVTCSELAVDHYDPSLEIDSPVEGTVIYHNYVTIVGEVEDPDAVTGLSDNYVVIEVYSEDGSFERYEGIQANNDFSYTVNLTAGANASSINTINVYAIDRSGATSAVETVHVMYSTEFPESAIQIVSPFAGISLEPSFELIIETYLDADLCGYSKNDASLESSIPFEKKGTSSFGVDYDINPSLEGVPEYIYLKCRLENDVIYEQTAMLMFDNTSPTILGVELTNSDGKEPPKIVEAPLQADLVIETDDITRCKYGTSSSQSYDTGMYKFEGYDDMYLNYEHYQNITGLSDETSYTYYLQCQNGAFLTSEKVELAFSTNLSAASGIYLTEPATGEYVGKTSETNVRLRIGTTRTSNECYYGQTEADISTLMTPLSDKDFSSEYFSLTHGLHTFYFTCLFVDGFSADYFDVIIDTTPPDVWSVEDGGISYSNYTLGAWWNSSDDLTDIVEFSVSIGTMPRYNDVVDWFNTTNMSATVQNLSLVNRSTYYWNVKAKNEVGMWSDTVASAGVFIDATTTGAPRESGEPMGPDGVPNYCTSGAKDGDETDVDCGGSCNKCGDGMSCTASVDCISLNCGSGSCQAATCTDVIKNQGESDIDCGGNYCALCLLGQSCVYDSDCDTSYCYGKVCSETSCYDNIKNGNEEGVDCGGSCPDLCPESVKVEATCFDSIRNQGEEGIDCGGPCQTACEREGAGGGFWFWIIIVLVLALVGVGTFYGYTEYYEPKFRGTKYDLGPYLEKAGLGKYLRQIGIKKKGIPQMKGPKGPIPRTGSKPVAMQKVPGRPGMQIRRPTISPQKTKAMKDAKEKARQEKKKYRSSLFSRFDGLTSKKDEKVALKPKPVKPVVKPVAKPVTSKPVTKPVVKPVQKPVAKPVTKEGKLDRLRGMFKKSDEKAVDRLDNLRKGKSKTKKDKTFDALSKLAKRK